VNTVLRGTEEACLRDARERIAIAGPGGYILSTACSVPPRAPAENVLAIARAGGGVRSLIRLSLEEIRPARRTLRRLGVPADVELSPALRDLATGAAL
jgi:hypothetical protein